MQEIETVVGYLLVTIFGLLLCVMAIGPYLLGMMDKPDRNRRTDDDRED